jgi:hypothetical protein
MGIFVKSEKRDVFYISLKDGKPQRRGSHENAANIVNSAISGFCDSVDGTLDRLCCSNESSIRGNEEASLCPQKLPYWIKNGDPNHRWPDIGF